MRGIRVKGKLFKYTIEEFQRVRELLGAKRGAKRAERREIILLAEMRGLFCETIGDCAKCDGNCQKKPAASGCLEPAPAVA